MSRFILIDHSLIDYSGHHYEYAQSVLSAAMDAGFRPILATNRQFNNEQPGPWPVYPVYKYGVWFHQGAPRWQQELRTAASKLASAARRWSRSSGSKAGASAPPGPRRGVIRSWHHTARLRRFLSDSRELFSRLAITRDDIVFLPTLSLDEFVQLSRARRSAAFPSDARWHVVFRRELPAGSPAAMRKMVAAFEPFTSPKPSPSWRFWTDSDELATQYARATGCRFDVLPIPHVESPNGPPAARPFRILYLGDARREKGFHYLPALVKELTDGARGRFEFYFQSHVVVPAGEPDVVAARRQLAAMSDRGVTLLNGPLASTAYRKLLSSGHLNLLLYDSKAYASRSSGVFAESLAAGIPTIVPENTWMAKQLPRDAGLVYKKAADTASLIRHIEADHPRYVAGARASAARWREQHNATRLVSLLANSSL